MAVNKGLKKYAGQLDGDLRKVFSALADVSVKPYRLFYNDEDKSMYVQLWNLEAGKYDNLLKIDPEGNVYIKGGFYGGSL